MATIDLTPFGFTATESVVYSALLRLGPATGYGVGRATRLARANAYAALEGLVTRGAAQRAAGRPAQYRPADPRALLAPLRAGQGGAPPCRRGDARPPGPRSTSGSRARPRKPKASRKGAWRRPRRRCS